MAHVNAVFRENGKAPVNVGSQSMPHAHTVSVDSDTLGLFPAAESEREAGFAHHATDPDAPTGSVVSDLAAPSL